MALAVVIFLVVLFTILQHLMQKSRLNYRDYGAAVSRINSAIIEYIQGMSTIRTFDAGQSSYSRFSTALENFNQVIFAFLAKVGAPTRLARSRLYANADHVVFDRVRRVFTLACAAFHLWLFCLFSVSRRVN